MKTFIHSMVIFFWGSFSFSLYGAAASDTKQPPPKKIDYYIEGPPGKITLQRIKRKFAAKLLPLHIGPGPICIYKTFFGPSEYDNYLCTIVGQEAYLTLQYVLTTLSEEEAMCRIKTMALSQQEGPLLTSEDIYRFFEKGAQQKELVAKAKCLACEDKGCNMAGPCGHMVLCEGCSKKVQKCPICRAPIQKFLKIYPR